MEDMFKQVSSSSFYSCIDKLAKHRETNPQIMVRFSFFSEEWLTIVDGYSAEMFIHLSKHKITS